MSQTLPPLHVLLLAESPYFGGITSHLLSIVDALGDDPALRLSVASLPGRRDDNALGEALAARGRELQVLPMSGSFDPRVIRRLKTFAQERGIDLVHTHNYRATVLAYRAISSPRPDGATSLVATFHGLIPNATMRLRFWQAAERRVFRRLPLIAACSDAARQQLIDHGISADRTRIVHNAASPPAEIAPIDRARLALPNDRPFALFIGRLIPSKRGDLVLRAAATAGWSVAIVGEGPERADLEALAQRLQFPAHFAGFQADPWPWHAAADAVVLPSEMEALPMTLIEAAACGKPAIATQVGGIPEVVRQEETGLLVPRGDEAGLADALVRLKDSALRQRLGAAARAHWQAHFGPEVMAETLKRLYFEACPR